MRFGRFLCLIALHRWEHLSYPDVRNNRIILVARCRRKTCSRHWYLEIMGYEDYAGLP